MNGPQLSTEQAAQLCGLRPANVRVYPARGDFPAPDGYVACMTQPTAPPPSAGTGPDGTVEYEEHWQHGVQL